MFDACVTAYDLIDLQQHAGGHPRLGSVDLVPIHPLSVDVSLDECGTIARGNQNPGLFDRHINIIYRGGGKGDGGGGGVWPPPCFCQNFTQISSFSIHKYLNLPPTHHLSGHFNTSAMYLIISITYIYRKIVSVIWS